MNCSQCGKPVAAGARFCGGCGAVVQAGPSGSRPSEFHVIGDVMQAVVVPLKPGEEIQAEPGALLYMAGDVEMDSQMKGGLWGGLKRMVAGESLFMTKFRSRGEGQVAFAAPHPGKLKRIDLDPGRDWLCQRDSFLCATEGVDVNIAFTKRLGAGFFGGEGFILQRLSGDGTVFIHGGRQLRRVRPAPGPGAARRHRLHRRLRAIGQLRHPVRGRLQERAVRR